MEQENNNSNISNNSINSNNSNNKNGVIALLVILVVVLAVLCVLFATGTISFKSKNNNENTVNDNTTNNDTVENSNTSTSTTNNTDTSSVNGVRYYQYYLVLDNTSGRITYTSHEVELNTDGSARWRFGGNGQGGDNYKGTYTEDSNKIVLTLERDMPNNTKCDDNNTSFPCKTTVLFDKRNENAIVSYNELGVENASYEYKLVDKASLHFFD